MSKTKGQFGSCEISCPSLSVGGELPHRTLRGLLIKHMMWKTEISSAQQIQKLSRKTLWPISTYNCRTRFFLGDTNLGADFQKRKKRSSITSVVFAWNKIKAQCFIFCPMCRYGLFCEHQSCNIQFSPISPDEKESLNFTGPCFTRNYAVKSTF